MANLLNIEFKNLSTCLKMKSEATRNMDMKNKQFMCGEVEAYITKILTEVIV
jgi:hypothetical protein